MRLYLPLKEQKQIKIYFRNHVTYFCDRLKELAWYVKVKLGIVTSDKVVKVQCSTVDSCLVTCWSGWNIPFLRVSVHGVESLDGHFATLCRGFDFYEVKRKLKYFYTFNHFKVKSLHKEQNSTNLLLWPPFCQNNHAITPMWINS